MAKIGKAFTRVAKAFSKSMRPAEFNACDKKAMYPLARLRRAANADGDMEEVTADWHY